MARSDSDAANDHVREARDALRKIQTGRIWFGEAAECLNPIIEAIRALDRLAGLDNAASAKHVDEGPCEACTSQTPKLMSDVLTEQGFPLPQVARVKDGTPCDMKNCPEPAVGFLSIRGVLWAVCRPHAEQKASEADA